MKRNQEVEFMWDKMIRIKEKSRSRGQYFKGRIIYDEIEKTLKLEGKLNTLCS